MISIKKDEQPESLRKRNEEWKKTLSADREADVQSAWKNFDRTETRAALEKASHQKCAYCEARYRPTGYMRVEHFRPKSTFPELCFEWTNLWPSCEACNTPKWKHWNDEILDLNVDDPHEHFAYVEWLVFPKTAKGKATADILDFEIRTDLIQARKKEVEDLQNLLQLRAIMVQQAYAEERGPMMTLLDGLITSRIRPEHEFSACLKACLTSQPQTSPGSIYDSLLDEK